MELPSSDLLDLFMKLLPGFLAAAAFHALTPYPKRDVFERVVAALIFTLFAQLIVAAIRSVCISIGTLGVSLGAWSVEADLGWGAAAGLTMGVAWAHVVNNGLTHGWLRKLGTTKKTSLPTQWFSAFAQRERYVILQFKDGRRLMGWPLEWPDEPEAGHFLLERPGWVLDDGTKAAMHQIEVFLVCAKDVEAVEFLRFNDDRALVDNQTEIESAKSSLANARKESANGKQRNTESSDRAAGHEPASDAPTASA
jgi:hypothetical protein